MKLRRFNKYRAKFALYFKVAKCGHSRLIGHLGPLRRQALGIPDLAFTSNSAIVLFWWLTVIKQVAPDRIDPTSFLKAQAWCDEQIDIDLSKNETLGGYTPTVLNSELNGLISNDDDIEIVEKRLLLCSQIELAFEDGKYVFILPTEVTAVHQLFERDFVVPPQLQIGQSNTRNTLGLHVSLSSCKDWEYKKLDMPTARVFGKEGEVGETIELGELPFTNDVWQAGRIANF